MGQTLNPHPVMMPISDQPTADTVEAPTAQSFIYQGKRFIPVRPLTPKESAMSLSEITRAFGLADCPEFQRAERPDATDYRPIWNHADFYQIAKAAGAGDMEVFRLGNQQVIPCQNYLAMLYPYCYGRGDAYYREPQAGESSLNPYFGPQPALEQPLPFATKRLSEYATPEEWLSHVFIVPDAEGHAKPYGNPMLIQDKRNPTGQPVLSFCLLAEHEASLRDNPRACREFLRSFFKLYSSI